MNEVPKNNAFVRFLKVIQDYWFLITLLFSALATLFYFIYFDVNPLEKQYENKIQTLSVDLHNNIALSYLQQGYFEKALIEFENALTYKSYNKQALNGKLLAELFLSLKSIEHNPNLSEKTKNEIAKLEIDEDNELYPIRKKYYADNELGSGNPEEAINLYENLLAEDSNYVDLLFTYGWLNYELGEPDLNKMSKLFSKLTEIAPKDFRGYHGYAYAMYMKAVYETDPSLKNDYIFEAANQCINAYNLIYTRFNVALDLGEIIRSIEPLLAVDIHLKSKQLLDDPTIMAMEENSPTLGYKLLMSNTTQYVIITTLEQKKALVFYELALDYLADYRKNYEITSLIDHDDYYALASELDQNGNIRLIYEDQKAILDMFLPEP